MTQIDQIIADALAGSPETHVAILAREVVRLRGEVAVPALPVFVRERIRAEWGEGEASAVERGWSMARLHQNGKLILEAPSSSVLVDAKELDALLHLACVSQIAINDASDDERGDNFANIGAALRNLNLLRANQGGADHV